MNTLTYNAIPSQQTILLILRFTDDTSMSMSEGELDFNYMMFQADTVIILDPPNLLATDNIWFRLDSAATGVVEILRC